MDLRLGAAAVKDERSEARAGRAREAPSAPAPGGTWTASAARDASIAELAWGTRTATRPAASRAHARVREWLRAVGLRGTALEREVEAAVAAARAHAPPEHDAPAAAVQQAQARLDGWLDALRARVAAAPGAPPDPASLRRALRRDPGLYGATEGRTVAALAESLFASAQLTVPPNRMPAQPLRRAPYPRWLVALLPSIAVTAGVVGAVGAVVGRDGVTAWEWALLGLWAILTGLSAHVAWLASWGAWPDRAARTTARDGAATGGPLPRSAVVVPIFHEDVASVFARIAALRESLLEAPGGDAFEIFVLSDTRDPLHAAAEERAWRRVVGLARLAAGGSAPSEPGASGTFPPRDPADGGEGEAHAPIPVPIFYRRRRQNVGKKSGNVQHFCERWGDRYTYLAVLDADSLMSGEALVAMARRLEREPRLGLLQAPVRLVRGRTPFARALQLASALVDPIVFRGLGRWSGDAANYYGHNALLRTRAFVEHCGLPALAGRPPFGGLILSHDFVEAALIRRGGWAVRFDPTIADSFEEPPPDPQRFLARDRRWSQGNLQHLRILAAEGLHPMSRIHLVLGAMAYLAAPLGLAFVALASSQLPALAARPGDAVVLWGALGATLALLMWPRLIGWARGLGRARSFGGAARLTLSVALEAALSALLAPRFALAHTRFVLEVLGGRAVGWGAQRRRGPGGIGRAPWLAPVRNTFGATAVGVATAAALVAFAPPALLAWLAPLWGPLMLAAPVDALASSERLGDLLARLGLLATPAERDPPPVLRRAVALESTMLDDAASRFRDVVLDPVLNAAVRARQREDGAARVSPSLVERALERGPAGLSDAERDALLADPGALGRLHREAWRHWPVEAWDLGRDAPAEPT